MRQNQSDLDERVRERTAELSLANAMLQAEIADRRRVEEALRKREAELNEVQRLAHVGNWVWDKETERVVWSEQLYRIFGRDPAQPAPSPEEHPALYTSESWTQLAEAVEIAVQSGTAFELDLELIRPCGERRWTTCWGEPEIDFRGQVVRLRGMVQDITDRKQAEILVRKSEQYLSAIVNSAADAIITIDQNGLIQSVNPATEWLFGYTRAELCGQNIKLLMPPPFSAEHDRHLARYMETGERRIIGINRELIGLKRDGSVFPLELSVSEIREPSRRFFTGIVRDISERKALQAELLTIAEQEQRRIGQDLHDDVGQELLGLALKMNTLADILQECDVPEHALARNITAGISRTLKKVRALSQGLIPVEVEPNGLESALNDLALRVGDVFRGSCKIHCPHPIPPVGSVVATQLYHIAQESIINAIKHGQPSTIEVSLHVDETAIRLEIEDDGCGIGDLPRWQAGVGLRIMRYRASMLGGTLEVKPTTSRGTRVVCCISRPLLWEHVQSPSDDT